MFNIILPPCIILDTSILELSRGPTNLGYPIAQPSPWAMGRVDIDSKDMGRAGFLVFEESPKPKTADKIPKYS